jgi:ferric-dicitrate binding protein FerR (iron transport regulator)
LTAEHASSNNEVHRLTQENISMNTKSPFAAVVTALLTLSVAIPTDIFAAPQAAGQRAGEVSRVIPAVSIARGLKTLTAVAKTEVDWQDLVNTQASARARIALEDGSVLNVGSESSVRVVKHDAGAQQTDLEVAYGKLRSQAQKIAQPGGKFEVRTPAGVAGVVGTDFYVAYLNDVMNVIVFDGVVKVCNLAGICVELKGGQMTTVRNGDSSGPAAPVTAAPSLLTEATNNTDVGGLKVPPGQLAHHVGKGTAITLGILAVIPAVVIPVVATRGSKSAPPQGQCPPVKGCT